jgi:predicted permease
MSLAATTLDGLITDVRHSLRAIARAPMLSAVVITSLGIGIGINTVVFSWIQSRVLRPLPGVADATRFRLIEPRAEAGSYPGISWLEYRDLRERLPAIDDLMAFRIQAFTVGRASEAQRTSGLLVSDNYFRALGISPAFGRFFTAEDTEGMSSAAPVVVSHEYWQTKLGGAAVVGESLRVNDRLLTIVAITPAEFRGTVIGMRFDLWVPARMAPFLLNGSRELEERSARGYQAAGKLTRGSSVVQAQTQLTDAMNRLAIEFPETNKALTGEVLPFWESPRGPQWMLVRALAILQGIMLVLLLAVCGNTATLLLARVSDRQHEVGVRLAIGAGPSRVMRLVAIESLMMALASACLGTALAMWGTTALRGVPLTTGFPVRIETSVDVIGLMFAVFLALMCATLFGAAPIAHLVRIDLSRTLHGTGRIAPRSWLRNTVMGAQVALALAVLMAAGLFLKSLLSARGADPGFTPTGVLLAQYDLTGRTVVASASREFARRILDNLQGKPGVAAVAIAQSVPLDIHGLPLRSFSVEGRARTDGALDRALSNVVTPGYFATMRIEMVEGADFVDLGDTTGAAEAIVNLEFVKRHLDGQAALGRRIQVAARSYTIVAVVRNSVNESFGEPPIPCIYFSYRDRPAPVGQIHVRTVSGDERRQASTIRQAVADIDPALPVYDVRTLSDHVETSLSLRKIPARMFIVLGPLLLVLAAGGIYAVVSYTVALRSPEIGVRLALGASPVRVVRQLVADNLRIVASGAAVGWLFAALVYSRVVSGTMDVLVFAGVPVLLLTCAAAASWFPARRVSSIDPTAALRAN